MTESPYQPLLEAVVDVAVQLEVGAEDFGLSQVACTDLLERLHGAFDGLPAADRSAVLRMVVRLSLDEERGPNREARITALDGIRQSLGGRD
ncbi:MAG: hypothetical protein J2P24_13255 [Streptosporangiales bacterium]|nr:hypothetical protein [Streptosporangiales bacterium]MBO0892479.1 hypothetical protein [Acidothermales bacterium]